MNSTEAADDLDALRAALGTVTADPDRPRVRRHPGCGVRRPVSGPGRQRRCWMRRPIRWTDLDARAAAVAVAAEKSLDTFAAGCAAFAGGCPLGDDPRAPVTKAVSTLDAARGSRPGPGGPTAAAVLLTLLLRLGDLDGWPSWRQRWRRGR